MIIPGPVVIYLTRKAMFLILRREKDTETEVSIFPLLYILWFGGNFIACVLYAPTEMIL